MLDVRVGGQNYVKTVSFGEIEQLAIDDISPAFLLSRRSFVFGKVDL